jgi:hypothetical protein
MKHHGCARLLLLLLQHLLLLRLILKHRQIRLESIKALLLIPTPGDALTIARILLLLHKQLLHATQSQHNALPLHTPLKTQEAQAARALLMA